MAEGVQVRAARGSQLRCQGWRQEGLLRMPGNAREIGERPGDLVVYGARGEAARGWEPFSRYALEEVAKIMGTELVRYGADAGSDRSP